MKLVLKNGGHEVRVGIRVDVSFHNGWVDTMPNGIFHTETLRVQEIIEPCEKEPKGLVKTGFPEDNQASEIHAWREYYPHALGMEFIDEE